MARKKKETMTGPDGTVYDVAMLHPEIVEQDKLVREVFDIIEAAQRELMKAKNMVSQKVDDYLAKKAEKFGTTWKGSTTLESFDETCQLERKVTMISNYGDNVNLARQLINQYVDRLAENSEKTRSEDVRRAITESIAIIREAIRLDGTGKTNARKMKSLQKLNIQDEDFVKAMDILSKSEKDRRKKTYYLFHRQDDDGRKRSVVLNFNQL